jgi:hypothetical protein
MAIGQCLIGETGLTGDFVSPFQSNIRVAALRQCYRGQPYARRPTAETWKGSILSEKGSEPPKSLFTVGCQKYSHMVRAGSLYSANHSSIYALSHI